MGIGDYLSPTAITTGFDKISDKADKFAKGGFDGAELNDLVGDFQKFASTAAAKKQEFGGGIWAGGEQELSKRLAKHPGLESYLKTAPPTSKLQEQWQGESTFDANAARIQDYKKARGE